MHVAPCASYVLAIATGSKSARITPADGLAFFTSAISLIGPPAASGAKKSRTGGASASRARSSASGTAAFARSISRPLRGHNFVENRRHAYVASLSAAARLLLLLHLRFKQQQRDTIGRVRGSSSTRANAGAHLGQCRIDVLRRAERLARQRHVVDVRKQLDHVAFRIVDNRDQEPRRPRLHAIRQCRGAPARRKSFGHPPPPSRPRGRSSSATAAARSCETRTHAPSHSRSHGQNSSEPAKYSTSDVFITMQPGHTGRVSKNCHIFGLSAYEPPTRDGFGYIGTHHLNGRAQKRYR